jgi:cytochrome c oxidase cbb3-type subunit III
MLLSRNASRQFLWLSLLLWVAAFHVSPVLAQQDDAWDDDFKKAASPGRSAFNSTCAGCHGLDGRGGDKGVNIAGSVKVQHLSDAQVSEIISNGVPGTGMPAFHSLSARQIGALVSYVRILQGKVEARTLPGDATRGKEIFFGKAECSTCHMVSGDGGFLGPDVSAYGSAMSAKVIRDEIVKSARIEAAGYRSAMLSTRGGDHLEGVIRNEDNFSIQLQTKDGSFHFFQKSDLQSVQPLGQSLMPTNYGQKLTPDELKDLVSYLMNGATAAQARTSHRPEDSTQ